MCNARKPQRISIQNTHKNINKKTTQYKSEQVREYTVQNGKEQNTNDFSQKRLYK